MTQSPPVIPGSLSGGLRPHRGTAILVLGILSLVISCGGVGLVLGIIAWVMGNTDLQEMQAGRMDPTGREMTQAGKVCGMISVILAAIGLVIGLIWLMFAFVLAAGAAAGAGANP